MNQQRYLLLLISINTCIQATGKFKQAYNTFKQGNYDAALHIYQELLTLHPHNASLLCNTGLTLKKLGRMEDAITIYKQAVALEPHNARAQRGISHAYLACGNFTDGWPAYEYRWVNPPWYVQQCKEYWSQHKSFSGQRVLLTTEYGLGDTLQFIRYARMIKHHGSQVIVHSHPALVQLLSLCPYIDTVVPHSAPAPTHDLHCLLMSLPLVFDTQEHTIPNTVPYLYTDEQLTQKWKNYLKNDHSFKIGICWQANSHTNATEQAVKTDAQKKSIPLTLLASLADIPNVTLYSLQKSYGIDQLQNQSKIKIFPHLDEESGPFMDTAAIMQHLDLVITIDTSIAHLAGGLGVPTWVLLPYHADWRWMMHRSDSPWYRTMRLFRQKIPGSWASVVETVKQTLDKDVKQLSK